LNQAGGGCVSTVKARSEMLVKQKIEYLRKCLIKKKRERGKILALQLDR
jgi:hypothetical protein